MMNQASNSRVTLQEELGDEGGELPPSEIGRASELDSVAIMAELVREAATIGRDIPLPDPALDFFYANSRFARMPRTRWGAEVRIACGLESIIRRKGKFIFEFKSGRPFGGLVDEKSIAEIASQLKSATGMLTVTFHGGFTMVVRHLFSRIFPDGFTIGRAGKYAVKDDPATALFAAREALLDGRPTIIGPDGSWGRHTGRIQVLGASVPVGDGAAFLAHSTGCETAWFAVGRTENGFVPILAKGPRRESGESFAKYRTRFFRFYETRLGRFFTGDPRNLALRDPWLTRFNRRAERCQSRQ